MANSFSSGQVPDYPEYNETLEWLYSQLPLFSRVGAAAYKPGLDNTLELDRIFGHPHRRFKSIHVAGTNGKGSTSHMLASILQSAGYKTALYTSPHLVDFRERIRINGEMIPHEKVVDFVRRWKETDTVLRPSFFELTMMMAFDWFASEEVDYAVIEVGMGGRLDSTNIITPVGCVITNISRDHTQFLGETLPEIAREKAGIMKAGVPVVIGEAEGEVRKVFEEQAAKIGSPINFAEDESDIFSMESSGLGSIRYKAWVKDDSHSEAISKAVEFTSPLAGEYQKKNVNTVLSAIEMLRKAGIRIDRQEIQKGMETVVSRTGFAGRWTVIQDSPAVIADTGHNEAGLSYNFRRLEEIMKDRPEGKLRMVFGMVADKEIDHILDLLPQDAAYYFTQASIPRALPAAQMADKAKAHGFSFPSYPTVGEAYAAALRDSGPEDLIYVGGSTFVVADFLASR